MVLERRAQSPDTWPLFQSCHRYADTLLSWSIPRTMATSRPTIVYGDTVLNGIPVRLDSRAVMRKAVEGHPIEVRSDNDYINLYHVFGRMQESEKSLRGRALVRRQIGPSRWLIFVGKAGDEVPDVELDAGYDPKRGRYKRFAERLAAGESLDFESKVEAIKARRAWQLYVGAESRRHLRSTVAKVTRTEKYRVEILRRG